MPRITVTLLVTALLALSGCSSLRFPGVYRIDIPQGNFVTEDMLAELKPGMTPAQITRLFQPFDQTTEGVSARHGGTGLGLPITKGFVELLGGSISVQSEVGKGSTFTVRVPVVYEEG